MKIEVHSNSLADIMLQLGKAFSAAVEQSEHTLSFAVPEHIGQGTVQVYTFEKGLSLFLINAYLKEDVEVHLRQDAYHPLRLIFCKDGMLSHAVDARFIQYQLKASQNSLSSCAGDVNQTFRFTAQMQQSVYIVEIDRAAYLPRIEQGLETLHPQLEGIFRDVEARYPFLYQGYYSVQAEGVLKQLAHTNFTGLILHTFMESKTLELLSLLMSQYTDDQKSSSEQILLRESDKQSLLEARKIVMEQLHNPPGIKELAVMVGINEFKLKAGYKQLFKTTVYQHIQSERLNRAKTLLEQGKWDVGEVVQMIGYVNKSHFAAKFKEKFGVLPKEFQKKSSV